MSPAKIDSEAAGRLTVRLSGTASPTGKKGHLPVCRTGPDDESDWLAAIAQWCFPPRRQHAGSSDTASRANNAGLISQKPKRATSRIAEMRRIAIINTTPGGAPTQVYRPIIQSDSPRTMGRPWPNRSRRGHVRSAHRGNRRFSISDCRSACIPGRRQRMKLDCR
jgi:hypothetical protein